MFLSGLHFDVMLFFAIVPLCPFIYRDIIFVIDNSADDLPDPDFESIKTFLIDVVDHFNISSTRTRVGIVLYAGDTQVGWYTLSLLQLVVVEV